MKIWLKRFSALLILGLMTVPGVSFSLEGVSEVVPGSRAAELENCVAETSDMRRNHMEYLHHKRTQTMRQGIRTPDFSLSECVACHAARDESGQYVSVNSDGQFCQTCHVRVAEKFDCFQCHRTTPESK